MGNTKGRRPLPSNVKRLHGTRASRINDAEPVPRQAEPEPPEWATAPWLAIWERVRVELAYMGLWNAADRDALVCLVHSVFEFDRLAAIAVKAPALVRSSNGEPRPNPIGPALRQQSSDVAKWCSHFGLTPSERGRISKAGAPAFLDYDDLAGGPSH